MFMAFASKEGGRKHWSVALADFTKEAPHTQRVHQYLEDADSDQINVKIARYGKDRLLISWVESATGQRKFAVYNQQGKREGLAENLPVSAAPRSDFKTLSGGSVAWAHCGETRKSDTEDHASRTCGIASGKLRRIILGEQWLFKKPAIPRSAGRRFF